MPSTLIPSLRYADAPAAIDWLVRAFGFAVHVRYDGAGNRVEHAQLTLGDGMVMLGTGNPENPAEAYMAQPADIGNRNTQGTYVVVANCPAIHGQAQAAGARIVMPLQQMSYGGMAFSCLDLEGHLWSFGEYDPWLPAPSPEDSA